MKRIENQVTTNNAQVAEHNQQQKPEREIAKQNQYHVGDNDQNLVGYGIQYRSQPRYTVEFLGNPAIESISDACAHKNSHSNCIFPFPQKQNQNWNSTNSKQGQEIR